MCLEVRKNCQCGKKNVQFHLRDNVMTQEVITGLYCPECSGKITLDPENMLNDNGWVIEYDIDLARFMAAAKLSMEPDQVRPGFIFDEGYATWREMYPGEQEEILQEKEEIMALMKEDRKRYLQEINGWNIARINRLKEAGWRKVQAA